MNWNFIFQIAAFSLGFFFTVINLARYCGKQNVPPINFVLMTIGIVTYIALHWPHLFQNVG